MKKATRGNRATKAASLALLLTVASEALGCASGEAPGVDGAAVDFGPGPGAAATAPDNEASPSTNVSTYPVSEPDSPSCVNATKAVYEFTTQSFVGVSFVTVHRYTSSFDEALSLGHTYVGPLSFLVGAVAGAVPVYRCLTGTAATALSHDPTCPGMIRDEAGLLGYVYPADAPAPEGTVPLYAYYSSHANDYVYSTSSTAPGGHKSQGVFGYVPRRACQNLSATCQMFPSSYSGYTVNPGPDPDTGEPVSYGDNAPTPPWFGEYGRAREAVSHGIVNAILPGDWGTANNVDWDPGNAKAECGYADWMTGLSMDPHHHGGLHAFRCATSEHALSSRRFGASTSPSFNCAASTADTMGNNGNPSNAKYFRHGKSDWDPGYIKHSCGPNSYLAGVSSNSNDWSLYHTSMCCTESGTGGDDCTTVVAGAPSEERNTSMTVDEQGNATPLDWDPPWKGNDFPKAECGAGRRMMGSSHSANGALHAILCCRTATPAPADASKTCCSPQTLQKAVASCNADHVTHDSDCDNIVAPCCNSDPNSDGVGGATCAAIAEALDADALGNTGPDGHNGGATAGSGSRCGATEEGALAWSFAFVKSGGAGSKTFGASYSGDVSFGAGPIYADGDARVAAKATLFGKTLSIAFVDLKGSITDASPLHAQINVLGKDLYVYPGKHAKQNNDAGSPPPTTTTNTGHDWTWDTHPAGSSAGKYDSNTLTYTETFFTEREVVVLFGVPVTITGTIAGQVGLIASANSAGNTLALTATPWVGATATCSAALGGGKGRFKLEAGVEGTLNLFTASLPTTALISPYTNQVNYTINSDFTLAALNGNVKAYLKVKLKPFFHKTFKTTLATWNGVTATTHLFHHNGCMTY